MKEVKEIKQTKEIKGIKEMKDKVSIVIAAYNEEKRILSTLERISGFFEKSNWDYEIILVNDGSSDGTLEITKKFGTKCPRIKIIDNQDNKGKGFVVRQGIQHATSERIIITDADLAYPIEQVSNFFDSTDGYDLVVGSRVHKGSIYLMEHQKFKSILARHTTSRVFNMYVRFLFGFKWKDTQCGLKVISARMAKKLMQLGRINGFAYDVEFFTIAKHAKEMRVMEIPVKVIHSYTDSKIKMYKHIPLIFFESLRIKWNESRGLYKDGY
jgi:dolichyl-phosphate beta-glucosyltransferase